MFRLPFSGSPLPDDRPVPVSYQLKDCASEQLSRISAGLFNLHFNRLIQNGKGLQGLVRKNLYLHVLHRRVPWRRGFFSHHVFSGSYPGECKHRFIGNPLLHDNLLVGSRMFDKLEDGSADRFLAQAVFLFKIRLYLLVFKCYLELFLRSRHLKHNRPAYRVSIRRG